MFEIYLEKRAEKDLKKLSPQLFHKIIHIIKSLKENPKPKDSKKLEGSKNDWRIRVGDYRILYEISYSQKKIYVMRVRHRKEVYR